MKEWIALGKPARFISKKISMTTTTTRAFERTAKAYPEIFRFNFITCVVIARVCFLASTVFTTHTFVAVTGKETFSFFLFLLINKNAWKTWNAYFWIVGCRDLFHFVDGQSWQIGNDPYPISLFCVVVSTDDVRRYVVAFQSGCGRQS